ncbi:MAG: phosphoglycerate mutase [Hyphomicrobiales bacterium]|nr:phosphoglycerate mutase [Hyphomicrobiales bacterium]
MLRLILLRHAKAAPQAGGGDSERPLTQRGRGDAQRVGDYLAGHGLFPDLAAVSTAKRTRETLELALETFGEPCPVAAEPRLYLAETPILLELLRATPSFVQVLLAVGHNPGCHEFAMLMVGHGDPVARARLEAGFPTAAFAVIDFEAANWAEVRPGSGVLDRFVTPADLG